MAEHRSVTIEGTVTPAAGVLARGERKTVAYTERIEGLVARGFVKIVQWHAPEPKAEEMTPDVVEDDLAEDDLAPVEVPRRNASREDWAEFLAVHTSIVTEGKTRDELVAEWEALNGED